ncbi:DUF222 domain-containing protein [Planococcus sp. APC 4015]|nr:DUF222 domain-containing protein [Planococcus sp. APC 4015]
MAFINDIAASIATLGAHECLAVETTDLPAAIDALGDDELLDVLAAASAIINALEKVRVIGAGVAARRSNRDRGHQGLAATQGHRTPAALVQAISGGTRADAERHVRLGTAMIDALEETSAHPPVGDAPISDVRWDSCLRAALLASAITAAQHDAIMRGLGAPPLRSDAHEADDIVIGAWTLAAEQLLGDASSTTAEDLLRRARQVRDALDPIGAEERFAGRFARRSFRMWTDPDGVQHGAFCFDDEMAAWVRSMIDAGLRPRRGGPRFVDSTEAGEAEQLRDDPRTLDQLQYDLIVDVLRAGSLATAGQVFGARQPGVRMVVVKDAIGPRDALGRLLATGHLEDGGDALPGSVIDRTLCSIGSIEVTVDGHGNPLDVGREQRLYTAKQRIALAVRDGGCMFPGCCVPPSYCEAHHCDHWWQDAGRTDIDRGILLCRFHHLLLHNNGWRITRQSQSAFMIHPPDGDPIELVSASAVRWAWDPPPAPLRESWRVGPGGGDGDGTGAVRGAA